MTSSKCFVGVASLYLLFFHAQQASHKIEYSHFMANSMFLSKERNKVQFTVNMFLIRLLSWQIFTNFHTFQDTFRSNKPLRCSGSPINACTDTLKLVASLHLKQARRSCWPRKMSNSFSSILLDVSARVSRPGS